MIVLVQELLNALGSLEVGSERINVTFLVDINRAALRAGICLSAVDIQRNGAVLTTSTIQSHVIPSSGAIQYTVAVLRPSSRASLWLLTHRSMVLPTTAAPVSSAR